MCRSSISFDARDGELRISPVFRGLLSSATPCLAIDQCVCERPAVAALWTGIYGTDCAAPEKQQGVWPYGRFFVPHEKHESMRSRGD
jgi:hypothetical protein